MGLEFEDLTKKIIGAAIRVHKALGPGFIESVYAKALRIELQNSEIKAFGQVTIPIFYDGVEIGRHIIDLMVENEIIVELKAIKKITDLHYAIVRSYLKASGKNHGLILNFSKSTLEIKRVIYKPEKPMI